MSLERIRHSKIKLTLLFAVLGIVFLTLSRFTDGFRIFGIHFGYNIVGGFFLGCQLLSLAWAPHIRKNRSTKWFVISASFFIFIINGMIIKKDIEIASRQEKSMALEIKYTPLVDAIVRSDILELSNLLEKGANFKERDKLGLSAIDYAAGAIPPEPGKSSGSTEAIQLLLKRGADINDPGEYGRTPLMYSVRSHNLQLIMFMIDKGADVNRISRDGHSALFYAQLDQNQEVVDLLKKSGANTIAPGEK